MIDYCEYAPALELQPFVECLWTLRAPQGFSGKRELIIPGGRVEIIFNFENPILWYDSQQADKGVKCQGAYLLGQRNRYFFMDNQGATEMMGVRFRPGGLAAFTNIPTDTFLNQMVPLTELFGQVTDELVNRLSEAISGRKRVEVMASFLVSRLQVNSDTAKILKLIAFVKQNGDVQPSVQKLGEQTGIHYKKLERIFNRYTGYSPKNFCRVTRFYRSLQQMKQSQMSLTQLGLQSGYYDQSHFIRDFKEFTGTSPSQFSGQNHSIANFLLQSGHI
jgi:AraC-like DNA-binding protein